MRAERRRDYEGAFRHYDRAAKRCRKKPRDCAITAMRAAMMLRQLKRYQAAVAAFFAIEAGAGRGQRIGARALTRAAELLARHLGQEARAEALWWRVIDEYPTELGADDALRLLARRYLARGEARALLREIEERYERLQRYDIADNMIFLAARVYHRRLKNRRMAARLYLLITRKHAKSPLYDDALWRAAGIRVEQERYRDAIVLYRKLLATREDASFGASYDSMYLDDSQLEIGRVYLLHLRDPARAITAFRRVVDNHETSVLRDDGLWWIVLAEIERGRAKAADRVLAELRRRFPRSRYLHPTELKALAQWRRFRRAAKQGAAGACAALAKLKREHKWTWLSRRGPKPKPWPRCPVGARPTAREGGRG